MSARSAIVSSVRTPYTTPCSTGGTLVQLLGNYHSPPGTSVGYWHHPHFWSPVIGPLYQHVIVACLLVHAHILPQHPFVLTSMGCWIKRYCWIQLRAAAQQLRTWLRSVMASFQARAVKSMLCESCTLDRW
jgi:hypothetical protein